MTGERTDDREPGAAGVGSNNAADLQTTRWWHDRLSMVVKRPPLSAIRKRASIKRYFFTRYNSQPWRREPISLFGQRPLATRRLSHVALFGYNAGDKLLPVMVRDLISSQLGGIDWQPFHVHRAVNHNVVRRINSTEGLVIGGGGLFLRDTNPNEISGWQWPCSVEMLGEIAVPMVVFAAGYNRFRGQDDFSAQFKENLEAVVVKSLYVGMRNRGSIEAVRAYLPPDLRDRVRFQPCPTTLAALLYPTIVGRDESIRRTTRPIALNCAFDRSRLRFGDAREQVLDDVARAMKVLSANAPIEYYSHAPRDEEMLPYLERHGVPHRVRRLYDCSVVEIIAAYAAVQTAIGMRGHAQMIPFGCRRPVVSLVSHDKLRFFLEDVGLLDLGVEAQGDELSEVLVEKVEMTIANERAILDTIERSQDRLWDATRKNIDEFRAAL